MLFFRVFVRRLLAMSEVDTTATHVQKKKTEKSKGKTHTHRQPPNFRINEHSVTKFIKLVP